MYRQVDAYEATPLPRRRPNTMNRGGLIVNEIGLEPLMDLLLRRLIAPLAAHLFSAEPFAASLDHHHSFVVAYRHRGDECGGRLRECVEQHLRGYH